MKYRKLSKKKKQKRLLGIAGILLLIILVGVIASVVRQQYLIMTAPEPDPAFHSKEQNFLNKLSPHAQEIQEKHGILTSITLAQAILESDWGQSGLAEKGNNLFGVKGKSPQPMVTMTTKEFEDGKWIEIKANFRKYKDWNESLDAHAALFLNGTTWNKDKYNGVVAADNYKKAAQELQTAGYATDPDYAEKLISIIEAHELQLYDRIDDKIYYDTKATGYGNVKDDVSGAIWTRPYGLSGAQKVEEINYYKREDLTLLREAKTDSGIWYQIAVKEEPIGWVKKELIEKK
ncbi:GW domain-containing glycosaminoglycan-binding protein [Listeria welshimeri]|uniref:N-acetylmuramoyl-L-alanine amidase (Autolysin), putative n=1 Tax=Listeria welshimeri serovar 6b (strain ATCC 35897 / DSM 20650 / CCUG 15529 / CIP 8149 / NCTC 11857 / SLCC 5334 / V8) TaxID=386043 RepID=A0AHV7_LISW6|nr:glucosaminidase domain-containing protein [Listeria welshimeri]MBC1243218.1 GW domain-containing glycosaminoglycan-binding protein [Listeria welshimeri]MBC1281915.1 GW domain-containing glycosaminoglycan-binding protein [Listeria welshimeri]MBC1318624.1 GW domain-containing glycosaminoglycan-binding protein [Listeria welshimeri]MBC1348828.1 GW domain-containing glycosaminoglycan-binding protein [Listeria welshimeri]MBC1403609.1 GW domain-containing glycosaminoglycan-binding protein [Listeri